jgi:hypothetical protein
MTIRTRATVAAALIAALALPAAASAKGPSAARIAGPGLSAPVTIEASSSDLGLLVDQTGFFPQTFGQSPSPLLRDQPAVRQLGVRYTVTYTVPGPTTSTVQQELYPYASGEVISYMEPGQAIWHMKTQGGWYRAGLSSDLRDMLVRAGLPRTPPAALRSRSTSHIREARIAVAAGTGLALTAGLLFLLHRRRH